MIELKDKFFSVTGHMVIKSPLDSKSSRKPGSIERIKWRRTWFSVERRMIQLKKEQFKTGERHSYRVLIAGKVWFKHSDQSSATAEGLRQIKVQTVLQQYLRESSVLPWNQPGFSNTDELQWEVIKVIRIKVFFHLFLFIWHSPSPSWWMKTTEL